MAIGVSYKGHDGRTQTFTTDGNPAAGSALDQIVRGKNTGSFGNLQSPMADLMRRSHKAVAPDPRIDKAAGSVKLDPMDQRPGTLKDKLDPSGSIDAGMRGLRLKGDDSTANNVVYGRHAGQSKFVTLDEIDDPTIKGQVIGATGGSTSKDSEGNESSNRTDASGDRSGNGPFRVNMQSRTEAEVNEDTGEVTFWEYTKPIDVTGGRRIGEIGGETKRKICSFFLGSEERQYTYVDGRLPGTVVRSHYTDANGKTQYEYWCRCLKWFDQENGFYEADGEMFPSGVYNPTYGVEGYSTDVYENLLTSGIVCPFRSSFMGTFPEERVSQILRGAYPSENYGHYKERPTDRPRKIVFDSGRSAIVDFFEEKDCSPHYNDFANGWTYLCSSEDDLIADGSFSVVFTSFTYSKQICVDEYDGERYYGKVEVCAILALVKTKDEMERFTALSQSEKESEIKNILTSNGANFVDLGVESWIRLRGLYITTFSNFKKVSESLMSQNYYILSKENAKGEMEWSTMCLFDSEYMIDDEDVKIREDRVVVGKKIYKKQNGEWRQVA